MITLYTLIFYYGIIRLEVNVQGLSGFTGLKLMGAPVSELSSLVYVTPI